MIHRPPNDDTASRRAAMLKTAFGPVTGAALEDDSVIEIMANPDGALWIERHGAGRVRQD
jgi:type IV secretion system protein VirB11